MDIAAPRLLPASGSDPRSFPARTHPGRPPVQGQTDSFTVRAGDQQYPRRCNPNRTRPPLDDRQRDLAARYLPLASAMARRMGAVMPEVSDELQSVAYLALVEAAGTFDPARSVNFATFARQHIQGAMIDFRRESRDRDSWDRRKTAGRKRRNGDPSDLARRAVNLVYEAPVGAELRDPRHLRKLDPAASRAPRPGGAAHLSRRHVPGGDRGGGGLLQIQRCAGCTDRVSPGSIGTGMSSSMTEPHPPKARRPCGSRRGSPGFVPAGGASRSVAA